MGEAIIFGVAIHTQLTSETKVGGAVLDAHCDAAIN